MARRAGVRIVGWVGLGLIVASAFYGPAAYAQTPVLSPPASPVDVEVPSAEEVADQVTEVVEPVAEAVAEAVEPATEVLETVEPVTEGLQPVEKVVSEPSESALAGPAVVLAPAPSSPPQRSSPGSRSASASRARPVKAVEVREVRRQLQDRRSGDLEAVASGGDEIEDTQVLGREIDRPTESPLALTGFDLRLLLVIAALLIGWGFRLAADTRGRHPAGAR